MEWEASLGQGMEEKIVNEIDRIEMLKSVRKGQKDEDMTFFQFR